MVVQCAGYLVGSCAANYLQCTSGSHEDRFDNPVEVGGNHRTVCELRQQSHGAPKLAAYQPVSTVGGLDRQLKARESASSSHLLRSLFEITHTEESFNFPAHIGSEGLFSEEVRPARKTMRNRE